MSKSSNADLIQGFLDLARDYESEDVRVKTHYLKGDTLDHVSVKSSKGRVQMMLWQGGDHYYISAMKFGDTPDKHKDHGPALNPKELEDKEQELKKMLDEYVSA